ncbi:MAG: cell division protein FtsZ, partial [Prevotella sp.]|nr:cell division protein FtsZ [Prevotella sp.]
GHINLDFADVKTTLKDGGVAIMSSGYGEGDNRVEDAIINALHSPLLNNNDVFNAKKILFNIYSSDESPLIIEEMEAVANFMKLFGSEIEVIWGIAPDNKLGEKVKITLLATGFGMSSIPGIEDIQEEISEAEEEERQRKEEAEKIAINNQINRYYGKDGVPTIDVRSSLFGQKPLILSTEELDDDKIVDALENTPVFKRDEKFNPGEYKPEVKKTGGLFND